jgi:hypothetical protein
MDYKFLDKVIDQLVSETRIDYDRGVIESPFFSPFSRFSLLLPSFFHLPSSPLSSLFFLPSFVDHCRDVYGLNLEETEYVWKEYRETIIVKINNGL